MKVSSPVGEFPFEPRRLRVEGSELVVEGAMGAWPAEVRVAPSDVPRLIRLVPSGWLVLGLTALATILFRAVRR